MKKLVIVDVNGTIIDRNYKLTAPMERLSDSIEYAKKNSVAVGLSSDSPIETLRAIAIDLNLDGPLVAESGAVIQIDNNVTLLNSSGSVLKSCSEALVEYIIGNRDAMHIVSIGDVNRLSRLLVEHGDIMGANASEAVFINGMRLASMSFFCLHRDCTKWLPHPEQLKYLTEWSLRYLNGSQSISSSDMIVDCNTDYGISIIHHKETNKSLAIKPLRTIYPNTEICIVGDSIFDWHGENIGVTHYAVANASQEYKIHCQYVANNQHTAGVIEIIEALSSC